MDDSDDTASLWSEYSESLSESQHLEVDRAWSEYSATDNTLPTWSVHSQGFEVGSRVRRPPPPLPRLSTKLPATDENTILF